MSEFKAITTVYSYYLPEIRKIISDLVKNYPHDVFLRSIKPGLDDFHQPIIDKLIKFHHEDVPALNQFTFRYSTAGSEEGIREFITNLQSQGVKSIYMFKGDYEGYREVAKTRNIETIEVETTTDPASLEPGYWFLSNPSARYGNIVSQEIINRIIHADHKIFYDLSYLGSTNPAIFDVSHPNIIAVAVSLSKPYGLFYYRIGFLFCRENVPSLFANKWFKNIYSLLLAEKIFDKVDQKSLSKKYKETQTEIIDKINQEHQLNLKPSDAFLLANLPVGEATNFSIKQKKLVEKFKRHDFYRFCLTPYFEEFEK